MISRLARLGYAAIGLVYMIVGGLAALAGMNRGGSAGGHGDAFAFILRQPFGKAALAVIALGLTGYVLWRFISAFHDTEGRGSDAKGFFVRAASIGRGLVYAAMTVEVVRMLTDGSGGGSGGEQQTRHWTATIMEQPYGRWLIALAGLGVVIYGAYQVYAAWDAKLSKRLSLGAIDDRVRRKVIAVSRFGIGARGVVFFVIGGSLVVAALRHDPQAAHATSGALAAMPDPLLAFCGIGLVAYGVYALVNARYRRITT